MSQPVDSKGQALLSEIVATAGKLERVTDRYAELGRLCNEFITLRLAQIENRSERPRVRAAAVKELEAQLTAAGLVPQISRWTKMFALVQLVPAAAGLPKSAAEQLLPVVRIDANSGQPAIAKGYETDLPKLVDTALAKRLTADSVQDLVQTLRKSKLTPEAAAKAAVSAATRAADNNREKLAELLENASEADLTAVVKGLSPEALSRLVESIDIATSGQIDSMVEAAAVAA